MIVRAIFAERWCDEQQAYVPTDEVIGYHAVSNDGAVIGWGDTPNDARDCLLRILWQSPSHSE